MRWTKLDLPCICFKKIKLTHRCFKSSTSICSSWIDHAYFLHFWPNKFLVSPTGIVSSFPPPWCCLSSDRHRHTVTPCHASFQLSQDELTVSGSSFGNASSCRLPSQAETEALNPHHHSRPPSLDCPTPTFHCYKKIISILLTLIITQSCLYFISSLARALRNQSSTHRRFLLPLFHTHRPSTHLNSHWQTSRHSFTSRTTYWYENLYKKIF
jgi:hypothetical protein